MHHFAAYLLHYFAARALWHTLGGLAVPIGVVCVVIVVLWLILVRRPRRAA